MNRIKKLLVILFVLYCLVVLSGCNTMKGIGKDFKALGEAIEEATQ